MFGIGKKKEEEKTTHCCCNAVPAEPQKESCCGTVKADNTCCPGGKMTVKVLGSGCKSCHALLENTQAAVKAMGKENDIQVEYVTDLEKIVQYGVMSMPALVICEKIASVGKVLRPAEIQGLIEKCC